ncbi:uncharacterized protein FIESC28_04692 [Fusarium coffeatum]|uniref:Xylanolytic transcriptional activator regulatory domain-containing protein n=1 Tax=Fusarium coffeatum TaxID=231269 RepID=A0A366RZT1_9HYPO|nr:uncharacterized protein FIESC28_04692 [Fusarium coffeatum]RBR21940.1 hypothetical protein FIESC28_04692 [Fusarium coffeatum]
MFVGSLSSAPHINTTRPHGPPFEHRDAGIITTSEEGTRLNLKFHYCDGQQPCKECRKRLMECKYRPNISTESLSDSTASCSPPRHNFNGQSPEEAEGSDTPDTNGMTSDQSRKSKPISAEGDYGFRIVPTSKPEEFGKLSHITSDCQQQALHLPLLTSPVFADCSATESFIALAKQHVKRASGSSEFTTLNAGPALQEASSAPSCPSWPPDLTQHAVDRIVKSYFNNTLGFIDVISHESANAILNQTYNPQSHVLNSDRCLIYLILAIGLALDSSPTERALQDPNLKERFFTSAELILRPSETREGSESHNGVPWTLRALVLMSFYMLCVSRRHTAHEYCGRATRIAHKFGIHRGKETESESSSDTGEWRVSRRNVWRSLFILDRFLAATLGSPMAIQVQYTDESLVLNKGTLLNPAVDACRIIGGTINWIYSRSRSNISMKDAKMLIRHLDSLTDPEIDGPPFLVQVCVHRVRSLRIYADILLCRPFFSFRYVASTAKREAWDDTEPQISELSQRCVSRSMQAINMLTQSTQTLHIGPFAP